MLTQRTLFTVPRTFSTAIDHLGQQTTNPIGSKPMVVKEVMAAKRAYDNLPPEMKAAVNNAGQKVGEAAKSRMSNAIKRDGTPQGFGGGSHNHSSGYSLTKAPMPRTVKLDTGIQPNTYTTDYMQAVENSCSPLHMTMCQFIFPKYTASSLYSYFLNVLAFDMQTKAQANVGFNLNLSSDFSAANIIDAFNALVYALQIYFYYSSIISYHSDPANKNEGMIYLRNQFTPQLIENLTLLGRRLADTPCPPKLLEFIRYLMGNFYSGPTSGSPMIKINPSSSTGISDTMVSATDISTALSNLATTSNNTIFALLRRAVPQWTIKTLYDVEPTPLYDDNFKTIFANLPFAYYNGTTVVNVPNAVNTTDTIAYNSFTEVLDGAAFAMTSVYNSTASALLPGLMFPINNPAWNSGTSRASYYQVSGVSKFYSPRIIPFLSRARQETYVINDAGTSTLGLHLFGADKCQSVTSLTIQETCYNVLDYLMSAETIKIDVRAFVSGKSSSGTSRPSRQSRKK